MADRVVLMREGRVEQNGAPRELYTRPESTFVAGFIGTPPMNLLEQSDRRLIGVRPEHLRFGERGQPAAVSGVEYLGADSIVLCTVGQQQVAVRVEGHSLLRAGEPVHIGWSEEHVHRFDPRTGLRMDKAESGAAAMVGG
jgi:sn-glycerol 3-phosphate transport system ATP-binding protein